MAAQHARRTGWLHQLLLLGALLAIAYLGFRVRRLEGLVLPISSSAPAQPLVVPKGPLADFEKVTTELFRKASGSVVHITTLELKRDIFHFNVTEVPSGTGSGFIWDDRGNIVTNFHVIRGASSARVTLDDHSVWSAQLVGWSRRQDLAVLKVPGLASRARALPLGSSNDLLVGQMVSAIGSPFGLDYTLSTGVISGVGREISGMAGLPIRGVIQTDAAINPGNSGGPLLDSSGRLIGVNTMIVSPSGASAGIGFAVPVDTVRRVVPQLIRFGREVVPELGAQLAEDGVARRLGIRSGVLVLSVKPDSPAAKAGLRESLRELPSGRVRLGDIIVGLDEMRITSLSDWYAALDSKQPGDHAKLTVLRDQNQTTLDVVLGSNVGDET